MNDRSTTRSSRRSTQHEQALPPHRSRLVGALIIAVAVYALTASNTVPATAAGSGSGAIGGDDCVVGGSGLDTIVGGAGTDVCIGGAGLDVFLTCETQIQ